LEKDHENIDKGAPLMQNQELLEDLFIKYGFDDFKWIAGKDIQVAQWVRVKCMYGCNSFGKSSACPPNVPTVNECERFFSEFNQAVIFHFKAKVENSEQLTSWCKTVNSKLSKLEKAVFLAGFYKTFVLYVDECNICSECTSERAECKNKKIARPCTEALAVDIYGTARSIGYPIQVLADSREEMNRYAILLIE
jgi:Predicted metal-binding protein